MKKFILLSVPNFIGNEKKYVDEAMVDGWVSTGGKMITSFEEEISKYVGIENAIAVQSGTAGLHLALKVLGVCAGQEVIVPTLTFIAAVNPVRYCNAEPVFMDCDDSLCMDMDKLNKFCKEECVFDGQTLRNKKNNKEIKVVVAVHVFGNMCDMEKLMEIATTYNLKVVEDSTEALGTYFTSGKYAGMFAGTIGDVGVYSFNGNKIITTGGGGMIVSNNKEYADKCRYFSTQAKDDTLYFKHGDVGYNYRMTNLQAALGLGQMECLNQFIDTKNENYDNYIKNGISLLPFKENIKSNKWFYSYMTDGKNARDELIKKLISCSIQVRPIWSLIHEQKPYLNNQSYKIEKAKYYQDRIVNLPCSTSLCEEDILEISDKIK